jgi:HPt (histidine-containing phosphotransfer) domain-containing protein
MRAWDSPARSGDEGGGPAGPPTPLDDVPLLDPASLLGPAMAQRPQYREIGELFLHEARRQVGELRAAVLVDDVAIGGAAEGPAAEAADRDRVARIAHRLAGSANGVGATRLAAAAARLEALARDDRLTDRGSPSDLIETVGVVGRELDRLLTLLADSTPDDLPERIRE